MSTTENQPHRFAPLTQRHDLGVLSGLAQNIASILNALILVRLVLSRLNELDAGAWLLFTSIGAYVSFLDFGIAQNVSREVAFAMGRTENRTVRLTSILTTAFQLVVPIAVASLLLMLVLGNWYFRQTDLANLSLVLQAWFLFATGATISILSSTLLAAVFGAGNLVADKLGRAATQTLGLILMVVAVLRGADLRVMAAIWLLQNVLLLVFAVWEIRKINLAPRARESYRVIYRQKFTRTMGYWTLVGLGNVLFFNFGGAVVGAQVSVSAVPQFDIPWRLAGIILMAIGVYILTGTPRLSALYASGEYEKLRAALSALTKDTVLLAVFAAIGAIWIGQEVIDLWTGGRVHVSPLIIILIGTFMILEAHTRLHMAFINATGQFVVGYSTLLLGLLGMFLSLFLTRVYGVVGVLLSLNLALLLTNAWLAPRFNLARLQFPFWDYFRSILAVIPSVIICVVFFLAVNYLTRGIDGLINLSIHGLTLVFALGASLWVTKYHTKFPLAGKLFGGTKL